MLLRRVTIENFRGLKSLVLDLDKTTVLIGENNCGKTSILEAIRLALSRSVRGNPFEDQDHHLGSNTAAPGDAGPTKVTLMFSEAKTGEWSPDLIQALSDAAVFDQSGLYNIIFSVTSSYDASLKDFTSSWDFLDPNGKALIKAKRSSTLSTLQSLFGVFYLTAFRDAAKDFSPKSAFWGPFLRNPSISDLLRL
jgi:putative ATP-dependent endonuclease of the OLD family